jgi:hypothetical protein
VQWDGGAGDAAMTISVPVQLTAPLTHLSSLGTSGGAKLDLMGNAMVVDSGASVLSSLWQLLRSGDLFSSSTTALHRVGLADNTAAEQSAINGVNVPPDCIIARYTWNGDANVDGVIGLPDYQRIDQGYVNSLTGWQNGDFNYDGLIGLPDYQLIDQAYVNQGTGMLAAASDRSGPSVLTANEKVAPAVQAAGPATVFHGSTPIRIGQSGGAGDLLVGLDSL